MVMTRAGERVPCVVEAAGEVVIPQVLAQADELLPGRARFERNPTVDPEIVHRHLEGLPAQQRRGPGPQTGSLRRRAVQKLPRHRQQFFRRAHFDPGRQIVSLFVGSALQSIEVEMAIRVSDPRVIDRAPASTLRALPGLLNDAADHLGRLYGERMVGAYLFGSQARGDAEPDSDIDILVVLNPLESHASEIERTSFLRADLSIRAGTTVSFVFVTAADWAAADTPFLATVRPDARAL